MPRVLITGGTGGLGSELVPRFAASGYTVRILSRRARPDEADTAYEWAQGDLIAGTGLAEAIGGCDLVVHCATNSPSGKGDPEATARICAAAKEADGVHVFYISIVGIERIPYPYYNAKVASEEALFASGVPWTNLRATQFHSLLDRFLKATRRIPGFLFFPTSFKFQPIDTGEVAARMVEYAGRGPSGRLPDLGGPEVLTAGKIARAWLKARGERRLVVNLPLPGKAASGFRRGYNCVPDDPQGTITWRAWLERKYDR